ncbi:MAG: hypothetical protein H0W67_03080 [Gemmatimonadales bacterium]|nr:hypothetical protein [Gemmatimonadales bacterium]
MRQRRGFLAGISALILAAAPAGCYGFAGGGLPPTIKTVAILPFDNQTSEPTLTQEINTAVRDAVESRLGLRQAGQSQADAIVRGSITRYEPDLPVAYSGDNKQVNVTRRLVQIAVSVEITDQRRNKPLWQRNSLVVEGDYPSGREAEGRRKALDQLVTNIVEGAQSQW